MLKRFNKVFGIESSIEEEKNRFVQRINQVLFKKIEQEYDDKALFHTICFWLGLDVYDWMSANDYIGGPVYPNLRDLTDDNFEKTIRIVYLIYQFYKKDNVKKGQINKIIATIFSHALVDIGIKWKNGMFYPSGAKEFDEKLIEEPFEWLVKFPDERKDFQKAIENFTAKKYSEVIDNCYLAIEGLTRKILNNKKVLDNNCDELLKKIEISQEWKSFLKNYINYANEFKRHASDKRHKVNPSEAEAFLYFTGLLIRLIIESKT